MLNHSSAKVKAAEKNVAEQREDIRDEQKDVREEQKDVNKQQKELAEAKIDLAQARTEYERSVRERLTKIGAVVKGSTPQAFAQFMAAEHKKLSEVRAKAGIEQK